MTDPLSPARLQAIRERLEKATPGPWEARQNECVSGWFFDVGVAEGNRHGIAPIYRMLEQANAELIAHAPTDLSDLLSAYEAAQREIAELKDNHAFYCANCGACGEEGCCPAPKCSYFKRYTGDVGAKLIEAVEDLRETKDWLYKAEARVTELSAERDALQRQLAEKENLCQEPKCTCGHFACAHGSMDGGGWHGDCCICLCKRFSRPLSPED
jgi:hypothetical protein